MRDIVPGCWEDVVAVPRCIADDYMRLAPEPALKVVLFLLSHRSAEDSDIKKSLRLTDEAFEEAVMYWQRLGVLSSAGNEFKQERAVSTLPAVAEEPVKAEVKVETVQETVPEEEPAVKVTAPVKSNTSRAMTPREIADRVTSTPEIAFMFQMAETSLKHILNHTEQRSLIWIHDYLGLPPAVILMLLEYCKEKGKTHVRYMEQVAIGWQEKDIDTVEAADREIELLKQRSSIKGQVMSAFGIQNRKLTTNEENFILDWAEKRIPIELITYAYDRSVDLINKVSFPYINKILSEWRGKGFQNVEQVMSGETGIKGKRKSGAAKTEVKAASYNLEEMERWAMDNIPELEEAKG